MPEIPPDVALKARILKAKYAPFVREVNPQFVSKVLNEAERYAGCYLAYWQTERICYLAIYRNDRPANDAEVYPWLQALFDRPGNGHIHEWSFRNYRFFFEGAVYTEDTVSEMIGDAFANSAEQDSNADAFDFEKTDLGKKLSRNGR